MIITPFFAVLTAFSPVPATADSGAALLATASGTTAAAHADVLNARLQICVAAIKTGIGPDQLKIFVKGKGFSEEAAQDTVDACSAFVAGYSIAKTDAQPNT